MRSLVFALCVVGAWALLILAADGLYVVVNDVIAAVE